MRVSVDEQDPGYSPGLIGRTRVTLDGVEQRHVVTADDVEGIVVTAEVSDSGFAQYTTRSGAVGIEISYG